MFLVGWFAIMLVGCVSSDDGATRSREFGGMIATSTLFDSGDIDVTLRDSAGANVASLAWRADEQAATWQVDGIVGGEFDLLPLTIDTADEMLFNFWLAAHRADGASRDEVAYDGCDSGTLDDGRGWVCCVTEAMGCNTWVCCIGTNCSVTNTCWGY